MKQTFQIGDVVKFQDGFWLLDSGKKLGEINLVPIMLDPSRNTIPFTFSVEQETVAYKYR